MVTSIKKTVSNLMMIFIVMFIIGFLIGFFIGIKNSYSKRKLLELISDNTEILVKDSTCFLKFSYQGDYYLYCLNNSKISSSNFDKISNERLLDKATCDQALAMFGGATGVGSLIKANDYIKLIATKSEKRLSKTAEFATAVLGTIVGFNLGKRAGTVRADARDKELIELVTNPDAWKNILSNRIWDIKYQEIIDIMNELPDSNTIQDSISWTIINLRKHLDSIPPMLPPIKNEIEALISVRDSLKQADINYQYKSKDFLSLIGIFNRLIIIQQSNFQH